MGSEYTLQIYMSNDINQFSGIYANIWRACLCPLTNPEKLFISLDSVSIELIMVAYQQHAQSSSYGQTVLLLSSVMDANQQCFQIDNYIIVSLHS